MGTKIKGVVFTLLLWVMTAGVCCAQELDSAVRVALDRKLAEYFAAIEREGVEVQKGECDFLIETCTDSLMRQHVALTVYDHYRDSKVMGSEAVAIHVFDRWIADEAEGYYVLFNYQANPEFPAELDRVVKITDGVLRSLIVKKN